MSSRTLNMLELCCSGFTRISWASPLYWGHCEACGWPASKQVDLLSFLQPLRYLFACGLWHCFQTTPLACLACSLQLCCWGQCFCMMVFSSSFSRCSPAAPASWLRSAAVSIPLCFVAPFHLCRGVIEVLNWAGGHGREGRRAPTYCATCACV